MKQKKGKTTYKVVFYPMLSQMAGNPYWTLLASGLKDAGVEVVERADCYKIGWLFKNRKVIDNIHIHYFQSLYCNSGHTKARLIYILRLSFYLLLARWLGYQTILTNHNLKPTQALRPGWIDYLGQWTVVNLAGKVIVHCSEARRLLAARYGRKHKVFEVTHPNYIQSYPNSITKKMARKQLNLTDDLRVFLFLGGIRPNKGIETLIQAFTQLEGGHYRLVVAGNPGTQDEYVNELLDLAGHDQRISFQLHFIPEDQVQVFLNACDIVVLPFARVLTSGSAILAMSFARAVIAPNTGCLPELLEADCGWLYKPGSVDSLVGAMRDAAISDMMHIGMNGFKKISGCSVENFVKQTLACYGIHQNRYSEIIK